MKKTLLLLLRLYKATRPFRPPMCRFFPSCSSYSYEALEKHGVIKGLLLTAWRIGRCHPFCEGGVDDVPETFEIRVPQGLKRLLHVKR